MQFSNQNLVPTAQEKLPFADLRRHHRIVLCGFVRDLAVTRLGGHDDAISAGNLRNAIHDLLELETRIAQHNRARDGEGKR